MFTDEQLFGVPWAALVHGFVIAVVRNVKLDPVEFLLKCFHHSEDDILVIVFLNPTKIHIG